MSKTRRVGGWTSGGNSSGKRPGGSGGGVLTQGWRMDGGPVSLVGEFGLESEGTEEL